MSKGLLVFCNQHQYIYIYTPKRWRFVRGHDRPIHGSCAIYFPGGVYKYGEYKKDVLKYIYMQIEIYGRWQYLNKLMIKDTPM